MASDLGTKDNAKADYTGWLITIFTSERIFQGWFPGSLFCLRLKLSTNSCQLSLFFAQFTITLMLSRFSTFINSRSRLARALEFHNAMVLKSVVFPWLRIERTGKRFSHSSWSLGASVWGVIGHMG